jgi:hypothetical protein
VFVESRRSAETATRRLREENKFAQHSAGSNCKFGGVARERQNLTQVLSRFPVRPSRIEGQTGRRWQGGI